MQIFARNQLRSSITRTVRSKRSPRRSWIVIAGALSAITIAITTLLAPSPFAWLASDVAAAEPPSPGHTFRDCNETCPDMVVVPAGSYMMGSDEESTAHPRHRVTIGQPLAVGKFEVTFAQWEACIAGGGCKSNPDRFDMRWKQKGWSGADYPAVGITWTDAKDYTAWLSHKTGKTYRLLSEAEWEYVARAGTTTEYSWGDDIGQGNANCVGCGSKWDDEPAPVGSFKPNAFGVHDMHGNVWEWVEDCFNNDFENAPSDGSARTTGCTYPDDRVQRGGAYLHDPKALRAVVRNNYGAGDWANGVGFRIGRAL